MTGDSKESSSGVDVTSNLDQALESLGTPRFREVLQAALDGAEPIKGQAYTSAYIDGVEVALLVSGVVGILGAILAWFLVGKRDPLHTVFDMMEERDAEPNGDTETEPARESV